MNARKALNNNQALICRYECEALERAVEKAQVANCLWLQRLRTLFSPKFISKTSLSYDRKKSITRPRTTVVPKFNFYFGDYHSLRSLRWYHVQFLGFFRVTRTLTYQTWNKIDYQRTRRALEQRFFSAENKWNNRSRAWLRVAKLSQSNPR